MVSLVIVSHSQQLAEGILELAAQMTHGNVEMAIAAGIDDPENPIGTDTIAVKEAIEQVYSPEGVLVLVDMGSAILCAEMARELLPPKTAKAVQICAAPLIEGAIAASVSAAAGMSLPDVSQEAHTALTAKYRAMEQQPSALPQHTDLNTMTINQQDHQTAHNKAPEQSLTFSWTIDNPHGLHVRPSAVIVAALNPFDAQIWVTKTGKKVNAKSINNIMQLGAQHGDTLTFTAYGRDAEQVINAIEAIAKDEGKTITSKQ
ncbi:PTS-dependent dihydroxyacetone kinase phosphotransferase subunit DhaM [Photobacterium sp. SDRW27]|uniref:dihydroxyacetone kinase phosphoryl donor subunit DhaM n=1 Tax=Photobacterium obscurum TaxID=2829490 RepID=UPI0022435B0B|nr:dihydroxyacetone kinase phosphoryl donor subunit DhaM [Photobacterium obscurum]MCW8331423.1 PTS-dependent dihydroxyacetone kinase phosphotransferase subunit DhaM [Photobacterium obscurum]